MTNTLKPVADFMEQGGQLPETPYLVSNPAELHHFLQRTQEEVAETLSALMTVSMMPSRVKTEIIHDRAEVLDGFIDTAYVALTGAIAAVGVENAQKAWEAVVDANLAKVDKRHGDVLRDRETGKILKPKGWKAPDLTPFVGDVH